VEGSKDSVKNNEFSSEEATLSRFALVVVFRTTTMVRRKSMNTCKLLAIIFCCILTGALFLPAARADEEDQMTKLTFREPIEIPGRILPAGTYWFVLLRDSSDRNIVQVFSEDRSRLCATLFTIPTIRRKVTDNTEIELAERPDQQPEAILKWYYPGLLTGHQFLYSSKEERQFARKAKQDVITKTIPL
jgi:hypothetical protein